MHQQNKNSTTENEPEMLRVLKNKKVIVTGGAGFIGSHLCEELVKLGAYVISVDNYSAGKKENIAFLSDYKNFEDIKKDVCDTEGYEEIFDGAFAIFHNAASKKNVCLIDPKRDAQVNVIGTLNMLQLAKKHAVKKFIHASTGSVYGEHRLFPSNEDHPLRPVSYYGVTKLAGEHYVHVFHHLYGLNTTALRYYHVYGPRQESNEFGGVVSIFLRNILEGKDLTIFGDGNQVRSFTWVKDIVRANLLSAVNDITRGEVYNCASATKITIKELAEYLIQVMNKRGTINIQYADWLPGDVKYFDVDNSKIRNHLGMKFEKDFWGTMEKTLHEFVGYLKKTKQT